MDTSRTVKISSDDFDEAFYLLNNLSYREIKVGALFYEFQKQFDCLHPAINIEDFGAFYNIFSKEIKNQYEEVSNKLSISVSEVSRIINKFLGLGYFVETDPVWYGGSGSKPIGIMNQSFYDIVKYIIYREKESDIK